MPLLELIRKNNVYLEALIRDAMVLAISDRGSSPPVVFRQADDKISYAISSQKRYNCEVQEMLHGQKNESKFYKEIEI